MRLAEIQMGKFDFIDKHTEVRRPDNGPAREEWDFEDDCRLPDEELEHALWYEYARESETMLKRHSAWRDLDPKELSSFDDVPTKILTEKYPKRKYRHRLSLGEAFASFYWLRAIELFDEFPSKPWLAIDKAKRRALINEYEGSPVTAYLRRIFDHHPGFEEVEESVLKTPFYFRPRWETVVAIRIDWRIPPAKIKEDFERWIEKRRHEVKIVQVQHREKLKALGGLRVWKHFRDKQGNKRGTVEASVYDAVEFTKEAKWSVGPIKQRGKPLYQAERRSWERVSREAKSYVEELFKRSPFPPRTVELPHEIQSLTPEGFFSYLWEVEPFPFPCNLATT